MANCVTRLKCVIPKFASVFSRSGVTTVPAISAFDKSRLQHNYRKFSTSAVKRKKEKETVTVNFILRDGTKAAAKAQVGENLLDIIIENDIDIDGFGACEGTLACSTCHLIFKQDDYDKLPEKPTDEELDMLDLAYGLTDTSRLGCQVLVTKDMDGLTVQVPAAVADAREPS